MIYFDNAATTRVSDAAMQAVQYHMQELYANPSAAYRFGVQASGALAAAREKLAALLGVRAEELIFTSCATESNNYAIRGILNANKQKRQRVLYSAAEHPSVANTATYMQQFEGCIAEAVPVDSFGRVRLDELERLLQEPAALVCLQVVNNELGTVQPVREAAELAHCCGAFVLADAVQAFGKIPLKAANLKVDALSVSGHKLHAPKGVGALWLAPQLRCRTLLSGGGQEQKRRSGTENLPSIAALSVAAKQAVKNMSENTARLLAVRQTLLQGICDSIKDIRINSPENAAPHILNISFAGVKSEVLLHCLEQKGICVSAGSACSTHKNAESGKNAMLMACGLEDKWTSSCIRFSFCADNTVAEAEYTAKVLQEAVAELRLYIK